MISAPDSFAPRVASQQAFDALVTRPTALLSYVSRGQLLIRGNSEQVAAVWARLPNGLTAFLLCADPVSAGLVVARHPSQIIKEYTGELQLSGWLGAFQVQGASGSAQYRFDLLLDLSVPPLLNMPVLPPGYFAPKDDAQALDRALAQLAELLGEFDKPKYFSYRPEICAAHTASVRGCQACVDLCGAAAIQSKHNGQIEVTAQLCQGCGDCTTTCPSGAIAYVYPPLGDTLKRLRLMLEAWRQAGGAAPIVLFYAGANAETMLDDLALPDWLLPYPLEALAAAGIEVWLSALAYGAAGVWLLDDANLSALTQANLAQQLGYANALLQAMGYSGECLRLVTDIFLVEKNSISAPPSKSQQLSPSGKAAAKRTNSGFPEGQGEGGLKTPHPNLLPGGEGTRRLNSTTLRGEANRSWLSCHDRLVGNAYFTPAVHAGQDDKRTALRFALQHLYRHASQSPQMALLPAGAPFGQIVVDAERCTLCMACVSVCPVGAILDGRDQPQLNFIESHCVQCSRCANACPEQAIRLQARYLFTEAARQPRVLHQAEVFCCVECGKPYASAAMIRSVTAKLQQHPLFQGEAARRLLMCEDCRINAHFQGR